MKLLISLDGYQIWMFSEHRVRRFLLWTFWVSFYRVILEFVLFNGLKKLLWKWDSWSCALKLSNIFSGLLPCVIVRHSCSTLSPSNALGWGENELIFWVMLQNSRAGFWLRLRTSNASSLRLFRIISERVVWIVIISNWIVHLVVWGSSVIVIWIFSLVNLLWHLKLIRFELPFLSSH